VPFLRNLGPVLRQPRHSLRVYLQQARPALERFLAEDARDQVRFYCGISYIGGGLVIRMKT
jgi:hypothetical protein